MSDNSSKTEVNNADEAKLKEMLLREELFAKRRDAGIRGLFKDFAPVVASVGALIAATVALSLARTEAHKQIEEVYRTKAEYFSQKSELMQVGELLTSHQKEIQAAESRMQKLQKREKLLMQQVTAVENSLTQPGQKKPLVGVSINTTEVDGVAYFIDIATQPSNAIASIYVDCRGTFVYPDKLPEIGKCLVLSKEHLNQTTPCRIGPFTKGAGSLRNDLWVVIDFGTRKEIRFVNLQRE